MTNELKFMWNGIKAGGKLELCQYSKGNMVAPHNPATITIYAKNYARFSANVRNDMNRITQPSGVFFGDPAIKAKYVARVEAHRVADEIMQGTGWDGERGCAVGCTFNGYNHNAFLTELNIDPAIGLLEDTIHEALPRASSLLWPGRFLAAIEPGADTEGAMVKQKFVMFLLRDSIGVVDHAPANALLRDCAALCEKPSDEEFAALSERAARVARTELAGKYADKLVELLSLAGCL